MKSNKFIILFVFVCSIAFSQEKKGTSALSAISAIVKDSSSIYTNNDRWSLEIGTGITTGTRPFTDGYALTDNNNLLNGFNVNSFTIGGTYNSANFISYKVDFSFDQFINGAGDSSKPFEVIQYRTAIQGQINLSKLAIKKDNPKFNLLIHGGFQFARLVPIPADYNIKKLSKGDNLAGVVFGITPTFQILKKISLFIDLSSYNNYAQNLTWNGLFSKFENLTQGHMYSISCGLSLK